MSAVALLAEGHAQTRRRGPRGDERQHLPLRRLSQHRRRGPAARDGHLKMRRPSRTPARRTKKAPSQPGRDPEARYIAGGTTLDRPDAARRHERPRASSTSRRCRSERSNRTPAESAIGRDGPQQRPRPSSARLRRVARPLGGAPLRRFAAAPQHGHGRRQSDAADAMLVLPRRGVRRATSGAGSRLRALGGYTRMHAVLGGSEHCIAVHPSDMCVALVALDAVVHVAGADGGAPHPPSRLPHVPGDAPQVETLLLSG